jgi:4-amino-4-deoxy-L-arabinose transferase-like glycosyltransferase
MATSNPTSGADDVSPPDHAPTAAAGERSRVRPEHFGLAGVVFLSCLLEFVRLDRNGYANVYYSAAVKSMLRSLHNFFFVSFDPNGLISVDKPPLGLWLQALSAKIFGFAPLPLLLPEAICGVLAVALMYFVVKPRFGALAGLGSALALAVFPSFVAVSRDNTLDSLLLLLMLAACGVALKAVESGRTRTLVMSAVLVGLAFNTKSLAALLCVPGIGLGYLLCAPGSVRRRLAQLTLAGVVLVVVAFSWMVAVQLTPASQRPYVGSSANNSEFNLTFGYNGVGRVGGQDGGPLGTSDVAYACDVPVIQPPLAPGCVPASAPPATTVAPRGVRSTTPIPFGSATTGPLRIFGIGLGDQGGWTVPFAVIGLIALVAVALPRWRSQRAGAVFVLGGWFVIELLALDFSKGIVHPYYVSGLGPGLAAVSGAGAMAIAWLVRSEDRRKAALGIALAGMATLTTVIIERRLIFREDYPSFWRWPLVFFALAALVAIVIWRRRSNLTVTALFLVLLVAPLIYSESVWDAPVEGTFPSAGRYNDAGFGGIDESSGAVALNKTLARWLASHHATEPYAVLTQSADTAAPLDLLGVDAVSVGGYNTTDPAMSATRLAYLVGHHEARYFVLGASYWRRGGNAASQAARRVCPLVPQAKWDPSDADSTAFYLVDCAGRADDLRHSRQVASAYIAAYKRAHPKR